MATIIDRLLDSNRSGTSWGAMDFVDSIGTEEHKGFFPVRKDL